MSVKILAHRGASAYAPENTLVSFEEARKRKADGVEFDVQLTKDGEIVVIHDERVDRTTDGLGYVKDYSLKQIKKLDAGGYFASEFIGQKIPTLEETLNLVKGFEIINIELKSPGIYPGIEEKVLKILSEYGIVDKVIISSFDHYSLKKVKNINNYIKTGMLHTAVIYDLINYAKKLDVDCIHPEFTSIDNQIVKECHRKGFLVNAYTVNNRYDIKKILIKGIDSVITNYPDLVRELL